MKYTITTNNNEYIVSKDNNQITLNNESFDVDSFKVNEGNYHLIKDGKTYYPICLVNKDNDDDKTLNITKLFKYEDKYSIKFIDFIYGQKCIKTLLNALINSISHILSGLHVLNENNICYFKNMAIIGR